MNHAVNGDYDHQKDEKDGGFPLEKNQEVHFRFFAEESGYRININGEDFAFFLYKFSDNILMKNLCIDGSLFGVEFSYVKTGITPTWS